MNFKRNSPGRWHCGSLERLHGFFVIWSVEYSQLSVFSLNFCLGGKKQNKTKLFLRSSDRTSRRGSNHCICTFSNHHRIIVASIIKFIIFWMSSDPNEPVSTCRCLQNRVNPFKLQEKVRNRFYLSDSYVIDEDRFATSIELSTLFQLRIKVFICLTFILQKMKKTILHHLDYE